jgi:hypothetical protein
MVAGQLIEEVTGKTWEDFMTEEVSSAAAWSLRHRHYEARWATPDRAFPHARIGGVVRGDGPNDGARTSATSSAAPRCPRAGWR